MRPPAVLAVALATCLLTLPALADAPATSAPPHRIALEDLARLVRPSDPQVSPDGKSILIVVSRPNYEDNRHETELVLVDVAIKAQRILTRGRQELGHPRWSPDGGRIAFLAKGTPKKSAKKDDAGSPAAADKKDEEGHRQIFMLPMNGGDALQMTAVWRGV